MTLVQNYQSVGTHVWQLLQHLGIREYFTRRYTIVVAVVFPHQLKIQRAKDEGFEKQLVCQNSRERRRHEGFTESNNIGKQDPSPLLDMMSCDLDRLFLKLEKLISKVLRNTIANDPVSRLLG